MGKGSEDEEKEEKEKNEGNRRWQGGDWVNEKKMLGFTFL